MELSLHPPACRKWLRVDGETGKQFGVALLKHQIVSLISGFIIASEASPLYVHAICIVANRPDLIGILTI